jgi:integrase
MFPSSPRALGKLGKGLSVPRFTRKPVWLLPHTARSGLFQRGDEFVADIKPDAGGRILRHLGGTRQRAIQQFSSILDEFQIMEEILGDEFCAIPNPRVIEFLDATFLPSQQLLRNVNHPRSCVRAIIRFLEARHKRLRLGEVRKAHGDELLAFYTNRAPRTRNGYLQKLKQAMNHAVDLGLLPSNPTQRCKYLRFDNRRLRTCSLDDVCALLQACAGLDPRSRDVPDVVQVMALTGLRPGNTYQLRKDEVEDDVIRIPPQKMKNSRWGVIPVAGHVSLLLQARAAAPYFFPSPRDQSKPRDNMRKVWRTITQKADIDWMQPYDLRHFFASQLAKQGATEQQIGRLLCHVSTSVTSRYIHQDRATVNRCVNSSGGVLPVLLVGLSDAVDVGSSVCDLRK